MGTQERDNMADKGRHPWRTREMTELFKAILVLETREEVERFFRDLCTLAELEAMAHRWAVARLVNRGITGQDVGRERGARVEELLLLGFGGCRLDAAVPEESEYERIEDLAGASVATVYPHLTRELMPVAVELVDVTGSVEVAPPLGLADGIVDLVSSGNTLRTNGLRSLGTLFRSEAVLIGAPGADASQLASMMRAVVEARAHRYLMLDAPEARLDEICAVIGSRSPSVLPLAEPGMVAVHALVPAKDVWQLLPRLEAVGAFSILVVPVERMLR